MCEYKYQDPGWISNYPTLQLHSQPTNSIPIHLNHNSNLKMMKLAFVVLLSLAAASAVSLKARQTVSSPRLNPFGVVENVEDCGSAGTLQSVAVTDCTLAPCGFVPGRTYDIDVTFIASVDANSLVLNIRALLDTGSEHIVASVPVEGTIVGGSQFVLSFGLPITTQFSGRSMVVWFELIDNADDRMEICATASAHIA